MSVFERNTLTSAVPTRGIVEEGDMVDILIIEGKKKKVFTKHGQNYTRKGYDIKAIVADKFSRKCNMMGYNESLIIEKLVEGFCQASGWGENVKSGPVFESKPEPHIQESIKTVVNDTGFLLN